MGRGKGQGRWSNARSHTPYYYL